MVSVDPEALTEALRDVVETEGAYLFRGRGAARSAYGLELPELLRMIEHFDIKYDTAGILNDDQILFVDEALARNRANVQQALAAPAPVKDDPSRPYDLPRFLIRLLRFASESGVPTGGASFSEMIAAIALDELDFKNSSLFSIAEKEKLHSAIEKFREGGVDEVGRFLEVARQSET